MLSFLSFISDIVKGSESIVCDIFLKEYFDTVSSQYLWGRYLYKFKLFSSVIIVLLPPSTDINDCNNNWTGREIRCMYFIKGMS